MYGHTDMRGRLPEYCLTGAMKAYRPYLLVDHDSWALLVESLLFRFKSPR
jgi:hypothetical protein